MAAGAFASHFYDAAAEAADSRGAPRRRLRLVLESESIEGATVLRDISRTGVLIDSPTALAQRERLEVTLPEIGERAVTVQWNEGTLYGCRFDAPIPSSAISAALLRGEPLNKADRSEVEAAGADELTIEKYPMPGRIGIIIGLTALSWSMVLGAGFAAAMTLR